VTLLQAKLAAVFAQAAASAWYRVDDIFETLMWTSPEEVTPADAFGRLWSEPTYRRLVFVSVAKNNRAWSVMVRRSTYPWSPTSQRQVSLTHAINILNNPESLWT